jgi:hypothetical protein
VSVVGDDTTFPTFTATLFVNSTFLLALTHPLTHSATDLDQTKQSKKNKTKTSSFVFIADGPTSSTHTSLGQRPFVMSKTKPNNTKPHQTIPSNAKPSKNKSNFQPVPSVLAALTVNA